MKKLTFSITFRKKKTFLWENEGSYGKGPWRQLIFYYLISISDFSNLIKNNWILLFSFLCLFWPFDQFFIRNNKIVQIKAFFRPILLLKEKNWLNSITVLTIWLQSAIFLVKIMASSLRQMLNIFCFLARNKFWQNPLPHWFCHL